MTFYYRFIKIKHRGFIREVVREFNVASIYKSGYNDAVNGREPDSLLSTDFAAQRYREAYTKGYEAGLRERQIRAMEKISGK